MVKWKSENCFGCHSSHARFQVLTEMLFKIQVLCDVMLCPLVFPDISQEHSAFIFGFQQSKKVGHYPVTQIHILGNVNHYSHTPRNCESLGMKDTIYVCVNKFRTADTWNQILWVVRDCCVSIQIYFTFLQ